MHRYPLGRALSLRQPAATLPPRAREVICDQDDLIRMVAVVRKLSIDRLDDRVRLTENEDDVQKDICSLTAMVLFRSSGAAKKCSSPI